MCIHLFLFGWVSSNFSDINKQSGCLREKKNNVLLKKVGCSGRLPIFNLTKGYARTKCFTQRPYSFVTEILSRGWCERSMNGIGCEASESSTKGKKKAYNNNEGPHSQGTGSSSNTEEHLAHAQPQSLHSDETRA